jgi:putative tricarboxylic transport membrane protein
LKFKDPIAAIFWFLVGTGLIYEGYHLEVGTLPEPGAGFMIFWMGIIIVGLSLLLFGACLLRPVPQPEKPLPWFGRGWLKILVVVAALAVYAYFLLPLGFLLSTFLLMIFLFKGINPQRWLTALGGAVLSSLVVYLVFHYWLGVQLPQGLFR